MSPVMARCACREAWPVAECLACTPPMMFAPRLPVDVADEDPPTIQTVRIIPLAIVVLDLAVVVALVACAVRLAGWIFGGRG